jgi:type I restriction enzyme M protein
MLTQETKRHIDAARQVLVGVVPNPASQIDQITNALIYKFMDDMDQSAIKAGGNPTFFINDLERFAWTRLMDTRLGNQERMNLYSEALGKFSEAKQLPPLFRDIFKSAFLPYRSPEVLGLFLKEIDYFDYSHSEELGNAYEYLLSVMGSQGDAGQFRTPRHIIDFIVKAVNPSKDDKVLDPACGTAGFLVSAYKHILEQHDDKNGLKKKKKPLTPDERKKIMTNFEGYDVDPGMVRISQVNMYLHHFRNPKVYNYNTLAQDERWADKFDVILANPPFMSPKGGVSTHNKFSVQSSRSEVLFVDYITNHLRPKGRAGIIFQSGSAHKQLRKNLVEDGLYAVVSLPSGVFQPYAGVKTSILLFNNELAKKNIEILFVKVENDGFDLGATKRPINKNDLPQALEIINTWKNGKKTESKLALYVEKTKILESGDYNLSGDRYRIATDYTNAKWPMVELGEVCEIKKGSAITQKDVTGGNVPVIAGGQQPAYYHNKSNRTGKTITVSASGAYAGFVNYFKIPIFASDCSTIQVKNDTQVLIEFVYQILKSKQDDIYKFQRGGGQPHVYPKDLQPIKIPLPPLEVQEQIVAELDGYQNIISGARQIVENWKPKINIDPEWEKVKLGDIAEYFIGLTYSPEDVSDKGIIVLRSSNIQDGELDFSDIVRVNKKVKENLIVQDGDILMCSRNGSKRLVGKIAVIKNLTEKMTFGTFMTIIRSKHNQFISYFFISDLFRDQIAGSETSSINQITKYMLDTVVVPFPPLEVQRQIVANIESERALVEACKKLIDIYEQKTKDVINKLWSEQICH